MSVPLAKTSIIIQFYTEFLLKFVLYCVLPQSSICYCKCLHTWGL